MKLLPCLALPLLFVANNAIAATEQVEVSGPILPEVLVLYQAEGANFPATLADEQTLVTQAAWTFPALLSECASSYPGIRLVNTGDPPLTRDELNTNYDQVAQCAYELHTAKPYWLPQLVNDVAMCETLLGADWHLISEADLASFSDSDYQQFADTLSTVADKVSTWGSFYLSLRVYVRGDDGTLKMGTLSPAASARVESLPVSGEALKAHLESDLSLRCLRRTVIAPSEVASDAATD